MNILFTVNMPGENMNVKSAFTNIDLFTESFRTTVTDYTELQDFINSQIKYPAGTLLIFDLQLPYEMVAAIQKWVFDNRIPVVLHYVPAPIGYL